MSSMTLNYLFYLGIIVPTVITLVLFIVFVMCLKKFRARDKVTKDKYDPHGKMLQKYGQRVVIPPPPRWDLSYKKVGQENDAYLHSATTTPGEEQPSSSILAPLQRDDSGVSEMNDIQAQIDNCERPYSQASSDSDDSGFRSSRSVPYLQNLSATHDTPLLKPFSVQNRDLFNSSLPISPKRSHMNQFKSSQKTLHSPTTEDISITSDSAFMCTCNGGNAISKTLTNAYNLTDLNSFHNLNTIHNSQVKIPIETYQPSLTVTEAMVHKPVLKTNHGATLSYSMV